MDENILWYRKRLVKSVSVKLEKNGFTVHIVENKDEATKKILEIVKTEESVGLGGSHTLNEIGLLKAFLNRDQRVIYNKAGISAEESRKTRKKALTANVYIASPNAIASDGKLMFVDKIGNRVAGMIYGPEKVIAVAGYNKIISNEDDGRERINNVASPKNAKRLGLSTPCAVTGFCSDCDSPERMCNIAVTLWKRPAHTEYHIILIPEELGY